MRIGIDARFWGPEGTGLGTYIRELVTHLEQIDQQNDYFIFLRRANFSLFKPTASNFHKVLADVRWYSLKEQVVMPWIIGRTGVDLMHFGHFNVPIAYMGKFVVTIHDLIKSEFASQAATTRSPLLYWLKHKGYQLVLSRAVARAARIIVPSQWVKERLCQDYHLSPDKIIVTYEAPDTTYVHELSEQMTNNVLARYAVQKGRYLIYVGNIYPHKNITRLLKSMTIITQQARFTDLKLVIGCARGVFYQRLQKEADRVGVADLVVAPGWIPPEDLYVLYHCAGAYVFPSLSEGFGLPGLDAMQAGLPVIAAKASALPEIYADAAYYFDPYDTDGIARSIMTVLTDNKLRQALITKGLARAKQFSWQKMAQETLAVYESAAQSGVSL